jgi:hypothetical protein
MSKRDVIEDNLVAFARSNSFDKAVRGWVVNRIVALPFRKRQSCELCGTRFREGAVVHHQKAGATILVGGTCLKTLQRHRFPPRFKFKSAKELTVSTLRRHYDTLVHPGNWIKWIVENAPRRLAEPAADLRSFGVVLTGRELDALIRFHDSRRLFPRSALLVNTRSIERILHIKIPSYITLDYARKIQRKVEPLLPTPLIVPSRDYPKHIVQPFMTAFPESKRMWDGWTPLEKKALDALALLDKGAAKEETDLCPEAIAATWPLPQDTGPMVVWNAKVGLGFVGADDIIDGHKAYVWLRRFRQYQRTVYDLQFWRRVVGCSPEAVMVIEGLSYQNTQ